MALVKLSVSGPQRDLAVAEVDLFGGRVVKTGPEQVIVEVAGEFDRVEQFLEALSPFRIVDLARSGPVAMSRGVQKP
jgi:acetolactate synthase-1/3 small subunit